MRRVPTTDDTVDPIDHEAHFAQNLRHQREAKGWSQGDLARRMQEVGWRNFHQTTVSRIEKGERPIRLGEAKTIASLLSVGLEQLTRPPLETVLAVQLRMMTREVHRSYNDLTNKTAHLLGLRDGLSILLERAPVLLEGASTLAEHERGTSPDYSGMVKSAHEALRTMTPERAVDVGRRKREELNKDE